MKNLTRLTQLELVLLKLVAKGQGKLKFNLETRFVVCINNQDYQASLEVRKIYKIIPDSRAAKHQLIRVIDESGEDYLYPVAYFVPIALPKAVEAVFA